MKSKVRAGCTRQGRTRIGIADGNGISRAKTITNGHSSPYGTIDRLEAGSPLSNGFVIISACGTTEVFHISYRSISGIRT
jgi:hypothetical protein